MNVVCISEDIKTLKNMKSLCEEAGTFEEIRTFFNAFDVEEYFKVDVSSLILCDIDHGDCDWFEQMQALKKIHKHLNFIILSESEKNAYKAFQIHASGYLVWPIEVESLVEECEVLRYSLQKDSTRIFAKTFGNFELYVDDRPVLFKNGKTKELFAFLFDRGTMCTNKEITAALWDDDEDHSSYLKKLRADMVETLTFLSCNDILIKNRGAIGIDMGKLNSDWFEWNNGTQEGKKAFHGEYMSQYVWAESKLNYILNAEK